MFLLTRRMICLTGALGFGLAIGMPPLATATDLRTKLNMKNITAPIKKSETGAAVENLQDGLLILLQKAPTVVPATERPALLAGLPRERVAKTYGDTTSKTVLLFQETTQKRFQLQATGDVDEPTAAALNHILAELGVPGITR